MNKKVNQELFGANRDNCNDELHPFSDLLEFLIMENLNGASEKTEGDSGLVIALDAKWGSGKTTFLKMFKDKVSDPYEKDREQGYIHLYDFNRLDNISRRDTGRNYRTTLKKDVRRRVMIIEYNAWENDYFDDPFTSLAGVFQKIESKNKKFCKAAVKLGETVLELSKCNPKFGLLIKFLRKIASFLSNQRYKKYESMNKEIKEFKTALEEFGKKNDENPLKIILVDELDRCKPQFAINFLEILKHFFNVENTVFVLALDKSILAENVRHCYGDIDGMHYLSRIFDFKFRLPTESKQFYDKLMSKYVIRGIDDQFANDIRKFFDLKARDWIKYLMNIKHLQKIPTWSRPEVYVLLAVKMFNDKAYRQLCEFDIASIKQGFDQEQFQQFIKIIKPNLGNHHNQSSLNKVIGKNLCEVMYNLFVNISNVNQKSSVELDQNNTLTKPNLIGIINAIDYMF